MESIFSNLVVKRAGIYDQFLDILFPRFCLRCGQEGISWCDSCNSVFQPKATITRFNSDYFLDGLFSIGNYADPVFKKAIELWKYYGDREVLEILKKWIQKSVKSHPIENLIISPAPLHIKKKRIRGFDQSEELAKVLAKQFNQPCENLLKRIENTRSQAQSGDRMIGDMDGIFKVIGKVPQNVLLCDDVFTSGATIDAAAKALKEAGAGSVWGFVIAKS